MSFCLPHFAAEKFLEKLKSGSIQPEKLIEMTSEERRAFFEKIVGKENAKPTNALFESKLILKNQQQGIINWAKQLTGITPEVRRDILSKVEKMTDVLQPKEADAFLGDLAEKKLGIGVTVEEAGKIAELSKKVTDARAEMENGGDRLDYGRAKVAFSNYVSELKNNAKKLTLEEAKQNPVGAVKNVIGKTLGTTKALKASLDVSALLRQGLRPLLTHPTTWLKNTLSTFKNVADTFGGKEVLDEVNADIVSRPNADLYRKAKLDVGNTEESFPSTIQEKIPYGIGKSFKAADVAFTAFQHTIRADIFDKYIEIAKKTDVDITDPKELQSIGRLVNSLTGRGHLGSLEPAASAINNVFFSPRALKANIDFLLLHAGDEDFSPFARKQAALNLVKVIGGIATVLTIAKAINPNSVETDPRSSDFGKIKIGDTRFDVTAGMASLATLAARLISVSTKSSTTHKVTPLNSGKFGAKTGLDVFLDFSENKLSPTGALIKDMLKGQDFSGNKPTVVGEAKNLFEPLPITNFEELQSDPKSADTLLAMIADALGVATNTYPDKKKK